MYSHADFAAARDRALAEIGNAEKAGGIGTLCEKLLHKILKLYFDPTEEHSEVEYLGSVADIKWGDRITEIQTAKFSYLVPKLEKFLPENDVTVVYPIIRTKNVCWIDPDTGEISAPRRSPRMGIASDVLPEAAAIATFIPHERLTVRLVFLTANEYKYLDGRDKTRKKGATKFERIPLSIEEIKDLKTLDDYKSIIPDLPEIFTAKDLNKATRLRGRRASYALKLLLSLGIVTRVGKQGRAYLYEKA